MLISYLNRRWNFGGSGSNSLRGGRPRLAAPLRGCEALEPRRLLSAGELDASFDGDGWRATEFGLGFNFDRAFSVEVYRSGPFDGRIVVAGESILASQSASFAVARYLPDGSFDTSFGGNGRVTTNVGGQFVGAYDMALQTDGKILVVGEGRSGSTDDLTIVRYDTDGSLDASFGDGGIVQADLPGMFGAPSKDTALAVAVDSQGRILVAGQAATAFGSDVVVARYFSTGAPDNSFGLGAGFVIRSFGGTDWAYDIAVDPMDNSLIVAASGGFAVPGAVHQFPGVMKFRENGTPETTFGMNGITQLTINGDDVSFMEIEIDLQGRIVMSGTVQNDADRRGFVTRLTSDGALDTFGSAGIAEIARNAPFTTDSAVHIRGMTLQDDTIVLVGSWQQTEFLLARLDDSGAFIPFAPGIDAPDADDNFVIADFSGIDEAWGIALDDAGRWVVAGAGGPGLSRDFVVARFEGPSPNLAIALADSPDPATVGSIVVININVSNLGRGGARNVEVSMPLPPDVRFIPPGPGGSACSEQSGMLTCVLGDMPIGATASASVAIDPSVEGAFTYTATVTLAGIDGDPSNNSATLTNTVVAPPPSPEIAGYALRVIDEVSPGQIVSAPIINDNGTVAYITREPVDPATDPEGGVLFINVDYGNGPVRVTSFEALFPRPQGAAIYGRQFDGIALDNNDRILFSAYRQYSSPAGGRNESGLFAFENGALTTLVPWNEQHQMLSVGVNDAGTIVFERWTLNDPSPGPPDKSILLLAEGELTTIADATDLELDFVSLIRGAAISSTGVVPYLARPTGGSNVLYLGGAVSTTISGVMDIRPGTPYSITDFTIGRNGRVFVGLRHESANGSEYGIYQSIGGTLTPFVETSGPFDFILDVGIEDSLLVFTGDVGRDTPNPISGIFTGPDPAADKVVATGDQVQGATIVAMDFGRSILRSGNDRVNRAGQVTTWARLSDGRGVVLVAEPNSDRDGIADTIENGAPSGGDGNGDSIPDAEQAHVASLPNAGDGAYVTLEAIEGAMPTSVEFVDVQATADVGTPPPAGVLLPVGILSFELHGLAAGAAVTVELTIHGPTTPQSYYKFGPEPGNPQDHWWEFSFDGTTGAQISGNAITLTFFDGGRGDADGLANGIIVDPGAPVNSAAALAGDYNNSGQVEQGDLDLVLLNWGRDATPAPEGWQSSLPAGRIDQDELDAVLLNWGATLGAAGSAVPAPLALDSRADRSRSFSWRSGLVSGEWTEPATMPSKFGSMILDSISKQRDMPLMDDALDAVFRKLGETSLA